MENFKLNFKEDILRIVKENEGIKKFKIKEILELDEESKSINNLFEKDYDELIKEKLILKNKQHKLTINLPEHTFIGKIYFSAQGSAFIQDRNTLEKYFISKYDTLNALNEDIVLCAKVKEPYLKMKAEAKVLLVLERTIKQVVGTYMKYTDSYGFVIADNERISKDFYIPRSASMNADSYDKVIIEITKYPAIKRTKSETYIINPEAKITQIIGLTGEKGVDTLSVIAENDIRDDFPADVKREASQIDLKIDQYEILKRKDFRNKIIYTIDGEDAKDLDDAISIEKTDNGYELGVHIADVSHYVKEESSIDKEAILRGTSVYLADRVIPMLPKVLSNGVCSLNEKEDKLTLSCIMNFDNNANLINSEICESIINSNARLNYTEVSNYLNGTNDNFEKERPEIIDSIILAKELSQKLLQKRMDRGSIEFDFEETKIELDEDGCVTDIHPYHRDIANDIIEEFMLAANETVAKTFSNKKIPFIYRIHENPREEKFDNFKRIASLYGLDATFDTLSAKAISNFIEENKDNENIEALKILLLQSMQQARYSNIRSNHFGLASEYYCHFTSPIRRYPDLQIHRIIKLAINGLMNGAMIEKYDKITEEIAQHCSKTERIADNAEIELDRLKISEYMIAHAGEYFEARIKSFNKVGMYIILDNTAEGFVKNSAYSFNEDTYSAMIGGTEIRLGQKIKCTPIAIGKNKEVLFDIVKFLD